MASDGWVVSNGQRGFQINGVTIYFGTGVPSNSTGADGDFMLRSDGTLLGSLIYKKAAGVWAGVSVV